MHLQTLVSSILQASAYRPDSPRLSAEDNAKAILSRYLYHSTCNSFAAPRPGSDGVFWTALNPAVAQNYIPEAGSAVMCGIDQFEMDQLVRPHEPWHDAFSDIARNHLGIRFEDVVFDHTGRATSWRVADGHPRYRDIVAYIECQLGYTSIGGAEHDKRYRLKVKSRSSGGNLFARADWKLTGWLWIVDGWQQLNFYDLASISHGDLLDPDYKQYSLFQQLQRKGYDGVRINDYCQSAEWGNVGHVSIGFFAHAIPKLHFETILAANFDWGPERGDLQMQLTSEFIGWANCH